MKEWRVPAPLMDQVLRSMYESGAVEAGWRVDGFEASIAQETLGSAAIGLSVPLVPQENAVAILLR